MVSLCTSYSAATCASRTCERAISSAVVPRVTGSRRLVMRDYYGHDPHVLLQTGQATPSVSDQSY